MTQWDLNVMCTQPCMRFCACLRLWVSHKNTHLSVRLYNKVISRRREWVTHAQTRLALWTLKEGVIKMEGEEWSEGGESNMCNHTHRHTLPTVHEERVCLHSGTRRCWDRLDPVRPGKVVMHHSAGTFHLHVIKQQISSVWTRSMTEEHVIRTWKWANKQTGRGVGCTVTGRIHYTAQ